MTKHLFTPLTLCCVYSFEPFFTVWSKNKLKTISPKAFRHNDVENASQKCQGRSPTEQTLISLYSISQSVACCGNVWVYAPSAGIVQTGRRANQPPSPARPCQLWSCREDEWMPSTLHCWDPPCAPSVAHERGHNLLLSALMVPSVDAEMAGLGAGAARWILPRAYCH